jgi:DedD protein
MRTLFDSDEEEIEGKASEITLSTASLLGIFFGLVLVCGVFFGFGYSMGRGTGSVARANTVMTPPASNGIDGDETAAAVPRPASLPVAPQAETQVSEKTEPAPTPAPPVKVKEDTATEEAPAKPALPVINKPAPGRQSIAYLPPTDAPASTA